MDAVSVVVVTVVVVVIVVEVLGHHIYFLSAENHVQSVICTHCNQWEWESVYFTWSIDSHEIELGTWEILFLPLRRDEPGASKGSNKDQ